MKGTIMHEKAAFSMEQQEEKTYEMTCVAPQGLGYGEGSISTKNREHDETYPLSPEDVQRAIDVLIEHRGDIIQHVEELDDGCGDGRPTAHVFQVIDSQTGAIREYNTSKNRAKIFGGGLQVAASMWRAIDGAPENAETVLGDRMFIASELPARNIQYGAHTDTHASGDNCGCGAIDKYPTSVALSGVHKDDIMATLPVFYDAEDFEGQKAAIEQAFASRAVIADDANYMSTAGGRQTMDFIEDDGAVVKQLADGHLEALTLVNEEPDTTPDQEAVVRLFNEAGLPQGIQLFVIDAWRGRKYATAVADIAADHGYNREWAHDVALADFFINQLSVATTLTDGTQPVVVNK